MNKLFLILSLLIVPALYSQVPEDAKSHCNSFCSSLYKTDEEVAVGNDKKVVKISEGIVEVEGTQSGVAQLTCKCRVEYK